MSHAVVMVTVVMRLHEVKGGVVMTTGMKKGRKGVLSTLLMRDVTLSGEVG